MEEGAERGLRCGASLTNRQHHTPGHPPQALEAATPLLHSKLMGGLRAARGLTGQQVRGEASRKALALAASAAAEPSLARLRFTTLPPLCRSAPALSLTFALGFRSAVAIAAAVRRAAPRVRACSAVQHVWGPSLLLETEWWCRRNGH